LAILEKRFRAFLVVISSISSLDMLDNSAFLKQLVCIAWSFLLPPVWD